MTRIILALLVLSLGAVSVGCKASASVGDSTNITAPR